MELLQDLQFLHPLPGENLLSYNPFGLVSSHLKETIVSGSSSQDQGSTLKIASYFYWFFVQQEHDFFCIWWYCWQRHITHQLTWCNVDIGSLLWIKRTHQTATFGHVWIPGCFPLVSKNFATNPTPRRQLIFLWACYHFLSGYIWILGFAFHLLFKILSYIFLALSGPLQFGCGWGSRPSSPFIHDVWPKPTQPPSATSCGAIVGAEPNSSFFARFVFLLLSPPNSHDIKFIYKAKQTGLSPKSIMRFICLLHFFGIIPVSMFGNSKTKILGYTQFS